jgi:hypothetical protein
MAASQPKAREFLENGNGPARTVALGTLESGVRAITGEP